MRRGPLCAILVSLVLLLQAATGTFASGNAGHGSGANRGCGLILLGAASVSPDVGGDAGHTPKFVHEHCAWCLTGASLPGPDVVFTTSVATEISTRLYFKNWVQPRSLSRIEPNAAPRAPPALS
jgi:hypothetical protein